MLRLNTLMLENFFSHRDTRIDLSGHRGLVLIEGKNEDGRYDSNGSGKSTILEGIVYALSGNTLRNVAVNDVVNRNAKKNTCVSLDFHTDLGGDYRVKRYRKDSQNGDKIQLWDVGIDVSADISKRVNKDTQTFLDSIVDIPYDVLVNTMLLGEGLSSRFTQLSDTDKKSLIESTLNLSFDISKCKDIASSRLKTLKLEKATLEGQIATLTSILNEDPEGAASSLAEKKDIYVKTSGDISRSISEIEYLSKDLELLRTKISVVSESINRYDALNRSISALDAENAHYIEELGRVESEESPICTLCKQLLESAESRGAVIENYRSLVEKNNSQITAFKEEISTIPDIELLSSTYDTLQDNYVLLSNRYTEVVSAKSQMEIKLATFKVDIEHLETLIHNHEAYRKDLEEKKSLLLSLEESLADYEYFYKLYSPTGIMVYILEEALEYINSRIKVYTDILLDKSYSLSLEKGKIILKDSKGSSYQSLSNGEKRRLDLCIQFSLHDYTHIYCGNSCNVLFLDEVLDTLDATGVNNIIEVLSLKRDYCKLDSIFVISHNQSLKTYFDEVITVNKDSHGDSYIIT